MVAGLADDDDIVSPGEVLPLVQASEYLSNFGDHRNGATMAGLRSDHFSMRVVALHVNGLALEVHVAPPKGQKLPASQTGECGHLVERAVLLRSRCPYERHHLLGRIEVAGGAVVRDRVPLDAHHRIEHQPLRLSRSLKDRVQDAHELRGLARLPVSTSQSDRHRSIERDVIASTRFDPNAGSRCAFIAELQSLMVERFHPRPSSPWRSHSVATSRNNNPTRTRRSAPRRESVRSASSAAWASRRRR